VDIGMMKTSGIKGWIYKYFRHKEKQLYKTSDYIGCMSPANCEYIKRHNPEIKDSTVEVCPNITVIQDMSVNERTRTNIRIKYNIPLDKKVFVYGGNLGKPQGIPFLINCLRQQEEKNAYFLIIGDGTEFGILDQFMKNGEKDNCRLMKSMPKVDFEILIAACDVGMIFLDYRFTIPNFPSRVLSYMKAKIPVFAVTDPISDIGSVIEEGGFGWWCGSDNVEEFLKMVKKIISVNDLEIMKMKELEFKYLEENYSPDNAYQTIMGRLENSNRGC
jgi:hypothetical protein